MTNRCRQCFGIACLTAAVLAIALSCSSEEPPERGSSGKSGAGGASGAAAGGTAGGGGTILPPDGSSGSGGLPPGPGVDSGTSRDGASPPCLMTCTATGGRYCGDIGDNCG